LRLTSLFVFGLDPAPFLDFLPYAFRGLGFRGRIFYPRKVLGLYYQNFLSENFGIQKRCGVDKFILIW